MDNAASSEDRKGIIVNDEGVTLTFVAQACGKREFGELVSWSAEELVMNPKALDIAVDATKDLFSETDDELNETILHDGVIIPFEPADCSEAEWLELVKQELGTRVNSVEELKELWNTTPLYAE
jgi:hypothetical protein